MSCKYKILITLVALFVSTNVYAYDTKAKSAVLMDFETGEYLFAKNHQEMIAPASMSKLMTLYLLLRKIQEGEVSIDDTFKVSENAWRKGGAASGSSTMFLSIGQKVRVEDLIRGIIIQSGNDACIVVAENLAGSEKEFVAMMNEMAINLGLNNSNFANTTGWPHPEHKMSVEDLALLSYHIIDEFPEFYAMFKEKEFTYNGIKQGNRNPLLYNLNGADGLKTGHTTEAGFCLTGSVTRGDRRLIQVIAGLESNNERSEESEDMMTWGFATFENYNFFKKNQIMAEVPVWYGVDKTVNAVMSDEITKTIRKRDKNKYSSNIIYDHPIKAPIKKGDKIGEIFIKLNDKIIEKHALVASDDVQEIGWFSRFVTNLKYLILGNGK